MWINDRCKIFEAMLQVYDGKDIVLCYKNLRQMEHACHEVSEFLRLLDIKYKCNQRDHVVEINEHRLWLTYIGANNSEKIYSNILVWDENYYPELSWLK